MATSEETYRQLMEHFPEAVVVHDGKTILYANVEALKMGGAGSEDDLVGRPVLSFVAARFHSQVQRRIAQVTQQQAVTPLLREVFLRLDGSEIQVEVKTMPIVFGTIPAVQIVARDCTDRIRAEQALAASEAKLRGLLLDKETILKEVHHRIKNNMATIKGLLFLQAEAVKDTPAYAVLRDAESRVLTMMALYDRLYLSEEFQSVSVSLYLPSLVQDILSCHPGSENLKVAVEAGDFHLSPDKLQPLGIILNELLTNILKYAFPANSPGTITVSAARNDDRVTVEVQDDGQGIPEGVDFDTSPGFGLSLVALLARGLKAKITMERGPGTRIVLDFPAV